MLPRLSSQVCHLCRLSPGWQLRRRSSLSRVLLVLWDCDSFGRISSLFVRYPALRANVRGACRGRRLTFYRREEKHLLILLLDIVWDEISYLRGERREDNITFQAI